MENITLARPYAKAAFAYAKEHKQLTEWANELAQLATIVVVPEMSSLLNNPTVRNEQLLDIVTTCIANMQESMKNFVKILLDNKRLLLASSISRLFNGYKSKHEHSQDVYITSAFPLTEEQQKQFTELLTQRLKSNVNLISSTDSNLIGGAIIRAGDEVIDGSVRGKLQQLAECL